MPTTSVDATAMVGTRHSRHAAAAFAVGRDTASSNTWVVMSHTHSTTPRTAVSTAMMTVTGMPAFTAV